MGIYLVGLYRAMVIRIWAVMASLRVDVLSWWRAKTSIAIGNMQRI
jgi:hypothetical protein